MTLVKKVAGDCDGGSQRVVSEVRALGVKGEGGEGEEDAAAAAVPPLDVIVVHTGVEKSTGDMVAGVKKFRDDHTEVADCILKGMGKISEDFLGMFPVSNAAEAYDRVGSLTRASHGLLLSLGVGVRENDAISDVGRRCGVSMKITGSTSNNVKHFL